jgi:hypothetical protein
MQVLFMGKITSEEENYKLRDQHRFYTALAEVGETIRGKGVELNSGAYTEKEWRQMISSRFIEKKKNSISCR